MNFRAFCEYKYLNSSATICGHCRTNLSPQQDIIHNPKHFYSYGQMYSCPCGKSKIWTNSIRNVKNLADFMNKQCDIYHNGFCNDLFCGHCIVPSHDKNVPCTERCFEPIYPLKTGVSVPFTLQRMDKFGCKKCPQNQDILMDSFKKDKENDNIMNYYKAHKDKLNTLADEGY